MESLVCVELILISLSCLSSEHKEGAESHKHQTQPPNSETHRFLCSVNKSFLFHTNTLSCGTNIQ